MVDRRQRGQVCRDYVVHLANRGAAARNELLDLFHGRLGLLIELRRIRASSSRDVHLSARDRRDNEADSIANAHQLDPVPLSRLVNAAKFTPTTSDTFSGVT